jgi:hypothetical protein
MAARLRNGRALPRLGVTLAVVGALVSPTRIDAGVGRPNPNTISREGAERASRPAPVSTREQEPSARPAFDWETALCPPPSDEPHGVLVASARASRGLPIRVLVALEDDESGPFEARLETIRGTSAVVPGIAISVRDSTTRGVEFVAAGVEPLRSIQVRVGQRLVACRTLPRSGPMPLERWDRHTEALFSLWVARLFSFAESEIFGSLVEVLRRPDLNLLHGALGLGEEEPTSGLILEPDCADLPFALRTYFAWKAGLPYGYARPLGGGDSPLDRKRASNIVWTDEDLLGRPLAFRSPLTFDVLVDAESTTDVASFVRAYERLAAHVTTKSLRMERTTDHSLLYPIALTREALRPGATFVDAFSHVSVVAGWVDAGGDASRLLVADAQPSGMIAVHRYFEGRLVYRTGRPGVGFRWFRPTEGSRTERYRPTPTFDLLLRPDEQRRASLGEPTRSEASFSEVLDTLETPAMREPVAHFRELHEALSEALAKREYVVAEGFARRLKLGVDTPVPTAASLLFHGLGVWEADATPCRDLNLLGLIRTIAAFPEAAASNPTRYRTLPGETPEALRSRLERTSEPWLDELGVTYMRSDGSPFRLSLRTILGRRTAFEMAYNPNDCPERRWGAPAGSAEEATCTLRAPPVHQSRMEGYRSWFRDGYGCESQGTRDPHTPTL